MRKIFAMILLLAIFRIPTASADLSVGGILGIPSGVTAKYYLDANSAIDAGAGATFDSDIMVWGDYLYHFPKLFGSNGFFGDCTPYVGGGLVVVSSGYKRTSEDAYFGKDTGSFGAGIRIPAGVDWHLSSMKWLSIYVEIAPGLSITPATGMFFQGGVGARYHF
jgi:hypothetical protein